MRAFLLIPWVKNKLLLQKYIPFIFSKNKQYSSQQEPQVLDKRRASETQTEIFHTTSDLVEGATRHLEKRKNRKSRAAKR